MMSEQQESSATKDDDSSSPTCPICWCDVSSESRTWGPCRHVFCQSCLERVLLASPSLCPMCRQPLCLFDLRQTENKLLYPHHDDVSSLLSSPRTPLVGSEYSRVLRDGPLPLRIEFPASARPRLVFAEEDDRNETTTEVEYQWHDPSRTMRLRTDPPLEVRFSFDWQTIVRLSWRRQTNNNNGSDDDDNNDANDPLLLLGRIYRATRGPPSERPARTAPAYDGHQLWGNVFCQALKVGVASYHFGANMEEDSYISYEHPTTAVWGTLDDGQALPSRVPFRNVQLDGLVFSGSICWWQDYGTTWHGMKEWKYEMTFDPHFYTILSGKVRSVTTDQNLETDMSVFGQELVYCNAALYEPFTTTVDDFRDFSAQLRRSLYEQGATVRTVALVHSVLTAARVGKNIVDWNLANDEGDEETAGNE